MYRKTWVEVSLTNIENNIKKLILTYDDYKYYFGVVKADCYGHNDIKTVKSIIKGGCNYLAVATLDEALEIRKDIKDIPILCLGIVPLEYIEECIKNNITLTISGVDYVNNMDFNVCRGLKVHIKLNTGMNRLGVSTKEELNYIYDILKKNNIEIEGLYTHIYEASNKDKTNNQIKVFENIIKDINLNDIKIIHMYASEALINYQKPVYVNGCRLGIAMYGITDNKDIELSSTFSLYSEVIQINNVNDETIGYNGTYKVKGVEKIAVIPIGYADGVIRKNTGRSVYINNKRYPIVGSICMDMMFVKVDDDVLVGEKVEIIKDNEHLKEISNYLDTIPYEVICLISKRVPRIYK